MADKNAGGTGPATPGTPDEAFIEEVLAPHRGLIGEAYVPYRNHILRMLTFCLELRPCSGEEQRKLEIAACFHDIGIWTGNTLDYLPPSLPPAKAWLEENSLMEWYDEIAAMILEHHRLRAVPDPASPLVELFRRGDLLDFSLGLFRMGLPRATIREVQARHPNAGFHRMLLRLGSAWFVRHPLNPAPMMKW